MSRRRLAARPGAFCSPSGKNPHLEAGWLHDLAPFARPAEAVRMTAGGIANMAGEVVNGVSNMARGWW
jgi:hypothetical protein